MIKQSIELCRKAYETMLADNAANYPKVATARYTVVQKQKTYMVQCGNCEYVSVIPDRKQYTALRAGEFKCKSCKAILRGGD